MPVRRTLPPPRLWSERPLRLTSRVRANNSGVSAGLQPASLSISDQRRTLTVLWRFRGFVSGASEGQYGRLRLPARQGSASSRKSTKGDPSRCDLRSSGQQSSAASELLLRTGNVSALPRPVPSTSARRDGARRYAASILRCSLQSSGSRLSAIRRETVMVGSCRPARMVPVISGARKASRTSRVT